MIQFRPLKAEDVEVRVSQVGQKAVQLLLYKTSRTDMALLDETVGPENWQCDYKDIDGKLFCGIGCRFQDGEWVWKWDTGVPSNMEAQKGEASDAFKRAGFKWNIGRELYTAPTIWVDRTRCRNIRKGKNGREQCYDDFRVTDMAVEDGRIVSLVICNASDRMAVVYGNEAPVQDSAKKSSKKRMWQAIQRYAELHGRNPDDVLEGIKKRPEWDDTVEFYDSVAQDLEADMNG